MRKFIKYTAAIGLSIILFFVLAAVLIPRDEQNYFNGQQVKREILQNTPSPRIVFIGESALAFGLKSQMVKDSLGYNVVNMGLHGGIGLYYNLIDIEDGLRDGDIVVLCAVFEQFYEKGYGGPLNLPSALIYNNFRNLDKLTLKQWEIIARGIPNVFVRYVREKKDERTYRISGLNEYGDEIDHYKFGHRNISKATPSSVNNEELDSHIIETLFAYIKDWEKRWMKIIFLPAPTSSDNYKCNEVAIRKVSDMLIERGYAYAQATDANVLPLEYFYDTHYHLAISSLKKL